MMKPKKRFRYTIKRTRNRRIARFGRLCCVVAAAVSLLPFVAFFRAGEIWWIYKAADFRPHVVLACLALGVFFLMLSRLKYMVLLLAIAVLNVMIMSASLAWPRIGTDDSAGLTVAFFHSADSEAIARLAPETDIAFALGTAKESDSFPFAYKVGGISVLARQKPMAMGEVNGFPWVEALLPDGQRILLLAIDFTGIYADIGQTNSRMERLAAFCASSAVPVAVIGNWQAAWWNPIFYRFASRSSLKSDAFAFPNFPANLPGPVRLSYGYAAYHPQLRAVSSGTLDAVAGDLYLPIYYKFAAVEK
ncbi:MAG: hypothetical protein FWF01_02260 [Alphaproteobacteria bacterium]|nr:hypothetical protein [Alphaproteobacteria bacterium]